MNSPSCRDSLTVTGMTLIVSLASLALALVMFLVPASPDVASARQRPAGLPVLYALPATAAPTAAAGLPRATPTASQPVPTPSATPVPSATAAATPLPATAASPSPTAAPKWAYVDADSLNVRRGPGVNYEAIGYVYRCDQVRVTGDDKGWSRVQLGNLNGFASNYYLVLAKADCSS
jgi:hypothetical protein